MPNMPSMKRIMRLKRWWKVHSSNIPCGWRGPLPYIKVRGSLFERAIIDTHWAFAHGQTYVALSRCKSLEGMVLSSKIPRAAVICDADVAQFTERAEAETPTDEMVRKMQADFYMETVVRLFDFHLLRYQYDQLRRLLAEHFNRLFPRTVTASDELAAAFYKEVEQVAVAFHHSSLVCLQRRKILLAMK